jgi:RHS repeat-associated protein
VSTPYRDGSGTWVVDGNGQNPRTGSYFGNRFMFTGREFIAAMGVYDYRHRFYHPWEGRFLQPDPLGLQSAGEKLTPAQAAYYPKGQAPETFAFTEMNLFRYCGDDPVNRTDPMGLFWTIPPELQKDFAAMRTRLKGTEFGAIIDKIAHDKQNEVKVVAVGGRTLTGFRGERNGKTFLRTIQWNPRQGLRISGDRGGQSPAMVFGHEASHADRHITDWAGYERQASQSDGRFMGRPAVFTTPEEERVITGPERNSAIKLMSLGETPRNDGKGLPSWVPTVDTVPR